MGNFSSSGPSSASRRHYLIAAAAGGATALIAACNPAIEPAASFKGTDITGSQWGRALGLSDHNGRHRTLADFKDKVVLLFFGYTNCPGPCPIALAEMAQVTKQVGADRVQGLFVTVDPERDTPEKLAVFVTAFHPTFLGLRGTRQELEEATKEFKIYYQAQKPEEKAHSAHGSQQDAYMVDHSTGIYAFDGQGRARLYFSANGRSVEAMVHDVKLLIKK